eukprot:3852502-Ditylum_brightwellii.AAC.1
MVIEHRLARMIWECNMLSQYNLIIGGWREAAKVGVEEEKGEGQDALEQGPTARLVMLETAAHRSSRGYSRVAMLPLVHYIGMPTIPAHDNSMQDPGRV